MENLLMTFAEGQARLERKSDANDRAFARLMDGEVQTNGYARKLAHEVECAAGDRDRALYALDALAPAAAR